MTTPSDFPPGKKTNFFRRPFSILAQEYLTNSKNIWVTIWLYSWLILGLLFLYILSDSSRSNFGYVILWALAYFILGVLVGFIFSIPKEATSRTPNPSATDNRKSFKNNLTEISDWLTKVVIGAGLVELKQIPPYIMRIAEKMSVDLHMGRTLCAALIVYYLCCGLIFGYLIMQLVLWEIIYKISDEINKNTEG
jgi:hypothetical protein